MCFDAMEVSNDTLDLKNNGTIAAPTYHEVINWLDGKKKFIFAEYRGYATYDWVAFIRDEHEKDFYLSAFPTREEALQAAILKALEMI